LALLAKYYECKLKELKIKGKAFRDNGADIPNGTAYKIVHRHDDNKKVKKEDSLVIQTHYNWLAERPADIPEDIENEEA
jgi:hypothetical protein